MSSERVHRRRSLVVAAAVAVAVGIALAARRLARIEVTGESMTPTLAPGERLLVVRGLPARPGDLVALRDPRSPRRLLVKRVVSCRDGSITVAGDNPRASTDSRHFGPVAGRAVEGRVMYRYWPAERAGWLMTTRPPIAPARAERRPVP